MICVLLRFNPPMNYSNSLIFLSVLCGSLGSLMAQSISYIALEEGDDLSSWSHRETIDVAEPLQEGETLRVGADISSVVNGEATLQIVLEESEDLSSWSHRETIDVAVPLQQGETRKFFRCAIKDASLWVDPDQFAVIPAGSFEMGDALDGNEASDAPVVTVNVSEFYMGKYEVTKSEWDAVRSWGCRMAIRIYPRAVARLRTIRCRASVGSTW